MTILVVFQQGGILGSVGQTLAIGCPLTRHGTEYNRLQDELVKNRIELKLLHTQGRDDPRITGLQQNVARLTQQIAGQRESRYPYLWVAIMAAMTSFLLYVGRCQIIQIISTAFVTTLTVLTILSAS